MESKKSHAPAPLFEKCPIETYLKIVWRFVVQKEFARPDLRDFPHSLPGARPNADGNNSNNSIMFHWSTARVTAKG